MRMCNRPGGGATTVLSATAVASRDRARALEDQNRLPEMVKSNHSRGFAGRGTRRPGRAHPKTGRPEPISGPSTTGWKTVGLAAISSRQKRLVWENDWQSRSTTPSRQYAG